VKLGVMILISVIQFKLIKNLQFKPELFPIFVLAAGEYVINIELYPLLIPPFHGRYKDTVD
jgi:hypothetical protein